MTAPTRTEGRPYRGPSGAMPVPEIQAPVPGDAPAGSRSRCGFRVLRILLGVSVLSGAVAGAASAPPAASKGSKRWTEEFHTSACAWSSVGSNDFFILEPGHQDVYDGHEGKKSIHLEITVLNETRKIGDVETRIVEERETHNGTLSEVSRNFFAICGPTNDVFYFGEDVDIYEKGKVASHEGSWTAGQAGAKPGLFMPSRPLLGARVYQDSAPGGAMDR